MDSNKITFGRGTKYQLNSLEAAAEALDNPFFINETGKISERSIEINISDLPPNRITIYPATERSSHMKIPRDANYIECYPDRVEFTLKDIEYTLYYSNPNNQSQNQTAQD